MDIVFLEGAWEDYLYWSKVDKAMVKKINELIKASMKEPFQGIGKPEPLKFDMAGCWSRRIDHEHRLVYKVSDKKLMILQCRYHY